MMIELLPKLLPLLIVDVLNPVLFALLLVAAGTSRPLAISSAFLAGHTAAYFVSGVGIALALEQIKDRLDNPLPIDFVIQLVIGVLCLWAALAARGGSTTTDSGPEGELTPLGCFSYGAIINFVGVPFALPYFAAVDQIVKANLSLETSLLALALYNAIYALPFLLVPILVVLLGDRIKPALEKINGFLSSAFDLLMPVLLLVLGLALSADSISYFVRGQGYI
jgi:cytochrome c biogenesis protein CcdA